MLSALPRALKRFCTVSWCASQGLRWPKTGLPSCLDFAPGQSFTFGSLAFIADGAGQLNIDPPPNPIRTIFFITLAFVIDPYGDLRLCVPPPHQATSVASTEPATAAPAFDSKDNHTPSTVLLVEARIKVARPGRCANSTSTHQPALTSHLVEMVCSNCIDDHDPEDCIWDDYITDGGSTFASLPSLSEKGR